MAKESLDEKRRSFKSMFRKLPYRVIIYVVIILKLIAVSYFNISISDNESRFLDNQSTESILDMYQ